MIRYKISYKDMLYNTGNIANFFFNQLSLFGKFGYFQFLIIINYTESNIFKYKAFSFKYKRVFF